METRALIIGGGPAGLMAADALCQADHAPLVVDAMPTLGRKFLMAGKSGLNLTRFGDRDFGAAYGAGAGPVPGLVDAFGPAEVAAWAEDLGIALFTGSTGRVFPKGMKASPLLRAWIRSLEARGAQFRTRWRWTGLQDGFRFDTPDGPCILTPEICILALGGASWRRLGSDGAWVPWLREAGVTVRDFAPANAGLRVAWSDHMDRVLGHPVKGTALTAGGQTHRGEFVISQRGLEGGGIYVVSRAVREGAELHLDLMPDWDLSKIGQRLKKAKGSLPNRLRKGLGLDPARTALLMEFGQPLPDDLAPLIKHLPVRHDGLRPLDEAISSAGGIAWDALDDRLQLRALPGTFACGEMLDWEAPTGGYLLTACLATGRHAGRAAARRLGG
ncbi:TIGR03862 family flavoprotein [Maribius pontilimi]|uniref:TIGR03862 family flavoprotein n=1 Tax=Palleronia pontilimi TaxID=1964209 RepID=A0A934IC00_9RHOB|nr:TIGR03862 family flavoprotein [Palleronia pontilimi]MBJ3761677.1 TIGR03862 family flavoprotein [Palleronia pontilimi]